MGTLYLVRHGQTVWNQQSRFQGHSDTDLSPAGRAQAARVREALQETPLSVAYASDLRRAADTAAIILGAREVPFHRLPDLRDRNWGAWEGMTMSEITERYADLIPHYRTMRDDFTPPGGEPLQEMSRRVAAFRERLLAENPEVALVVGHMGSLRMLLCAFLGLPVELRGRLQVNNAAICQIEMMPDRTVVTRLNDICHLEGLRGED